MQNEAVEHKRVLYDERHGHSVVCLTWDQVETIPNSDSCPLSHCCLLFILQIVCPHHSDYV